MKISPHLMFDGRCRAAFERYRQVLGGDLSLLRFGDSPMAAETGPESHDRIVHATLRIGDFELAGADVPSADFQVPQGFAVLLQLDADADAAGIFAALAEGGRVLVAFGQTFWSPGYGMVVDRFGVPWEVNRTSADE